MLAKWNLSHLHNTVSSFIVQFEIRWIYLPHKYFLQSNQPILHRIHANATPLIRQTRNPRLIKTSQSKKVRSNALSLLGPRRKTPSGLSPCGMVREIARIEPPLAFHPICGRAREQDGEISGGLARVPRKFSRAREGRHDRWARNVTASATCMPTLRSATAKARMRARQRFSWE